MTNQNVANVPIKNVAHKKTSCTNDSGELIPSVSVLIRNVL